MSIVRGYVLPGLPHPLLCPDANPGYQRLKSAFTEVGQRIEKTDADLIIVYSTMWPSVIGHQIQAKDPIEWTHVDELFHDLGSIPYKFRIDAEFAKGVEAFGKERGLALRTVNYHGFPVDTGSVVALKLINPNNRIPSVILSSNVYADRAETVVFGRSVVDQLQASNKKAVAVVISTLSNRLHSDFIDPKDDKIHSLKDHEWNLKLLEFFEKGRLEDVSQLSRQIHKEARVKKVNNLKSFWWLSTVMGAHNRYTGEVLAYEPVHGTGSAVIELTPAERAARDLEFDEDAPEYFGGDRNVLAPSDEFTAGMSSQTTEAGYQEGSE